VTGDELEVTVEQRREVKKVYLQPQHNETKNQEPRTTAPRTKNQEPKKTNKKGRQ